MLGEAPMCGICGEVGFGEPSLVRPGTTERMAQRIAHRGPDGEGFLHETGISLGHRRLSIIDLTPAAAQPMASPDGRYVIIYNGELYNHPELRADLERLGESFSTRSDTEVLLRALMVWGLEALNRFNGMWAFALWDRSERKLLLCRDRLGIKPLYWSRVRDGLVFASEIPPLLEHPEVSRELNPRALAEQVACRYVLAPRTLLKSVQKLPPGHLLTASAEGIRIAPYWRLPIGDRIHKMGEAEALERFRDLFEASVRRRLISDVPVGLLLSGGVDSSALAAALRHCGQERMATFTVAFEEQGHDERSWAKAVARQLETDHHEVTITPERFADSLDTVLSHLDDPVADVAVIPLYHVCGLASSSVKVLLSGQGADEVLGGYHLDRVLRQIRSIVLLRGLPGARAAAAAIARRDHKRAQLARWEEIRRAVPGQLPGKIRYDLTMPLPPAAMNRLLKDCMPPPYDRTLDAFYTEVPSHRGPLDAILSTLCKGWLPDNLLNHSDRMSMAHGLEMRVPFLDVDLLNFCFHLPQRLKINRGITKYLLKRYAVKVGIPHGVAYRRKLGFPVPWNTWVRGPLKGFLEETLEGADWMADYFHTAEVRRVLQEHLDGKDRGLLLWNLVVLAHWGRRMLAA
jgi:asparagine synthase (glutamine-hydrolysing)